MIDIIKKVLIVLGLMLGSFLGGRLTTSKAALTPYVQNIEVEKTKQEKTVTVEVKKPSGEIVTTTTKELSTDTHSISKSLKTSYGVEGLVGYDFSKKKEVYGFVVKKPLLSQLDVGVFILSNKSAGLSIGFSF